MILMNMYNLPCLTSPIQMKVVIYGFVHHFFSIYVIPMCVFVYLFSIIQRLSICNREGNDTLYDFFECRVSASLVGEKMIIALT